MTRDAIAGKVWLWKQQGCKVGLASGGFDLLHAGHVSFLMGLREQVNRLVVAVAADATLKAKGANRPVIPQDQRLAMVEALRIVDAAFIFTEYGDEENLRALRPDVFGRGDGHTEDMYESATLKELEIEIALIHTPRITSTTDIIARIRQ